MKTLAGALALFCTLGCSVAPNDIDIEPLEEKERPHQRKVETGVVESLGMAPGFEEFDFENNQDRSYHQNLELLKVLVSYGPTQDPRVVFLLVSFYLSANQQEDGILFFETFLKRYANQLSGTMKAHHLTAYAILRATFAERVPLWKRIGWVNDTSKILEEAGQLTGGNDFLVHWATGIIFTEYPSFFGKSSEALEHLTWTLEHPELEPSVGFYREVHRHLSSLHERAGDEEAASKHLELSGYTDASSKSLMMGPFMTTREDGTIMHSTRDVAEIVPGQVYVVRGFGFSELSFVISQNGNELIAIDAGTQPFSTKAAYELFERQYPQHPPLTSVLVTHAHWDHIGGHTFFRELNPDIRFYGRGDYGRILEDVQRRHAFVQFRSERFENTWLESYAPDVIINGDAPSRITIDGSTVETIPISGGETEDALLFFFPELSAIFVGDFLMPYYGEPWVEEGSIDGLLDAMTTVVERDPEFVLHGHFPLTGLYAVREIDLLQGDLQWLASAVEEHLRRSYSRVDIERLNLIPPGIEDRPESFIGYANARQHLPGRLHDQAVGIWEEDITGTDLKGLDSLSHVEYGRLLGRYLELSVGEVAKGLRRMIDDGDNELAFKMALAAERYYGDDARIRELKIEAADQLRSENQFINPFKYTVYSEIIGKEEHHVSSSK